MKHKDFFRTALAISLFLVLAVPGQTLAGSPDVMASRLRVCKHHVMNWFSRTS